MSVRRKSASSARLLIISAAVVSVLLLAIGGVALLFRMDQQVEHPRHMVVVSLMKPTEVPKEKPAPPQKEKPPEPPRLEKVAVVPPLRSAEPLREGNPKGDNKPAAEGPLGVEGEGGPGSDAFGLAGRGKGGRDITTVGTGPAGTIGGAVDKGSVMRKYGGYYRLVQEEMQRAISKRLEGDKSIPKGKLQLLVWVGMDDKGAVTEYRITRSSGNDVMDGTVKEYLAYAKMEPPPPGMPRGMSIRFTY